jgi:hypothetical protein
MPQEIKDILVEVRAELKQINQKLESAFLKDDNDEIDYQGHRQYHKNETDNAKRFRDQKAAIVKNILTWASIGLVTILTSSLANGTLITFLLSASKTTH